MPQITSKKMLLAEFEQERAKLFEVLADLTDKQKRDPSMAGGLSVRDILVHRAEWMRLMLEWYSTGRSGRTPDVPAKGFKWNQLPALNAWIQRRHQKKSLATVEKEFQQALDASLAFVKSLTDKELLDPGFHAWTGKNALASYVTPNTSSHLRSARKLIQRWVRQQRSFD